MYRIRKPLAIVTLFFFAVFTLSHGAYAGQIVVDGKTATSLSVSANVTDVTTATVIGQSGLNSFALFNVEHGNVVNLHLPSGASNLINLVHAERSQIHGILNAIDQGRVGGNVYFLNPHGLLVGASGAVNVGSFAAYTPTPDFMTSLFSPSGDPDAGAVASILAGGVPINASGTITIQGNIHATRDITLSSRDVTNSGDIASGALFAWGQVDFSDVVNVSGLDTGSSLAVVNGDIHIVAAGHVVNSGAIRSDGADNLNAGNLFVSANGNVALAPGSLLSARGHGESSSGGEIIVLAGGDASFAEGAVIDARGGNLSGDGGFIEFSAERSVNLDGGVFLATAIHGAAGEILIDPDELHITANLYSDGASFTLEADERITIAEGVTVSTRQTAGGQAADQANAASIGDSGNLLIRAPRIIVGNEAQLLAHAINVGGTSYNSGDITLSAAQTSAPALSAASANTSILLDGATLRAKNITLQATSDAIYAWDGEDNLVLGAVGALGAAMTGVNVAIAQAHASASITIGSGARLDAEENVTLRAVTDTEASTMTLAANLARANPLGIGFVYGEIDAEATVDVQSGATIAARNLDITARNDAVLDVNVYSFTFAESPAAEVAIGVTDVSVSSSAVVDAGAAIQVSDSLTLRAVNNSDLSTRATAMALGAGNAGIATVITSANTQATAAMNTDLAGLQNLTIAAQDHVSRNRAVSNASAGTPGFVVFLLNHLPGAANFVESRLSAAGGETVKLAGAVTIADSTHGASARIGAGSDVRVANAVAVVADVSDRLLQNHAISEVSSRARTAATTHDPAAEYSMSAAVAYGTYTHDAEAYIGEGASVAARNVGVQSDIRIPHEITWHQWDSVSSITSKINGTGGIANAFLTSFASAQQTTTEVGIAGSVSYLDFANTSRAYLGRNATITVLEGSENDWSSELPGAGTRTWDSAVTVRAGTEMEGVYASGHIDLFFDGVGGEDADAKSIGGSYNQVNITNTTLAYVAEGASIGPEVGAAPVDVQVSAVTIDRLITLVPSAGQGAGSGVIGLVGMVNVDNRTQASIDDEARVRADALVVRARQDIGVWTVGGAVTAKEAVGVGLVAAVNTIHTNTQAFIGDNDENNGDGSQLESQEGRVDANRVTVVARTEGEIQAVSVAAAVASANPETGNFDTTLGNRAAQALTGGLDSVGLFVNSEAPNAPTFGLSVSGSSSLNLIGLDTKAFVENATVNLNGAESGLVVRAVNNANVTAASGAAALTLAMNPAQTWSAGVAGSFAGNDVGNETRAFVRDSAVAGAQDVTVASLSGGEHLAVALGVALNSAVAPSAAASTAGSVSVSLSESTTSASVVNSTLVGHATAGRAAEIVAYDSTSLGTGGGSLVGGGRAAFGAAFSYSAVENFTTAYLDGAGVTGFDAFGVRALSAARIGAGAGVAGATMVESGGTFGGAIVVSEIANTISAAVKAGSTVAVAGGAAVTAGDTETIDAFESVIAKAGPGPEDPGDEEPASVTLGYDFSGSGAGAAAGDGSSVVSVAGVLQGGTNNVGLSFAWNVISNRITAEVADSDVTTEDGDVTVHAASSARVGAYAVGVGAAHGQFGGAGSVSVNEISNTVRATVSGAGHTVTANTLAVTAVDDSRIDTVSGQAVVGGSASIGAAIGVSTIGNTTRAHVSGIDMNVRSETQVRAVNDARIRTLSITAGGSSTFTLGGSVSSADIANTTEASIEDAASDSASNRVVVSAEEHSHIQTLSGAAALSGGSAVGAAVSVNRIANTTRAHLTGSAAGRSYTLADLMILSTSGSRIESLAVGVGGGVHVGAAGSTATNFIENTTTSDIQGGARVVAENNVGVLAQSDDVVSSAAGAAGIGTSVAGVGASVSVNRIGGTTRAAIRGSGTDVTALAADPLASLIVNAGHLVGKPDLTSGLLLDQYGRIDLASLRASEAVRGVAVDASATHSIENISANVAGGTFAGVAGTTSINVIEGETRAFVEDAAINHGDVERAGAGQALSVRASDHALTNTFNGVVAGGVGGAAVGVGYDGSSFVRDTTAYVRNAPAVRAAGGIAVDAQSTAGASSLVVSGAASLVGLVGNAAVVSFGGATRAYLSNTSTFSEDVLVRAAHESRAFTAVGAAVVGSGAGSASFAVVSDASETAAFISGSQVDASGDVVVRAQGDSEVHNWAVSGAVAGGTHAGAIAGQAVVSLIDNTTEAYVSDSQIGSIERRATSLSVRAVDRAAVHHVSGALGVSLMGVGLGAAASVTRVVNSTSARLDASEAYTTGDVAIASLAERDLSTVAVSLGAGMSVGIGGVAAVTLVGAQLSGAVTDDLNRNATGTLAFVDGFSNQDVLTDGENAETESGGLTSEELAALNAAGRVDVQGRVISDGTGSTTATVTDATISAGGDVQVTSVEALDVSTHAGGGGLGGLAAVGGAVGVSVVHQNVGATVMGGSSISAQGGISVAAGTERLNGGNEAVRVGSYQGSAGAVSIGAAVAVADVTSYVGAAVARGSTLTVSGNGALEIRATDETDVDARAYGFTLGGVAAGAVIARAERDGHTSASVSDEHGGAVTVLDAGTGEIAVTALRMGGVSAYTLAGAGGVLTGSGSDARAAETGRVTAQIGNQTTVNAPAAQVTVQATARPEVTAHAFGYGGAVAANVGVSIARATANPTVSALIGSGGSVSANRLVVRGAVERGGDATARSYAEAAGGGLLIGATAASSVARSTSTVRVQVDSDLRIAESARITADNETRQRADVTGIAGAVILAAGFSEARATSESTTRATLGQVDVRGLEPAGSGGSLTITATGRDDNQADALAGSGGVVSGAAAKADTQSNSEIIAEISGRDASSTNVVNVGSLTLVAEHSNLFNSTSNSVNANVLGASGSWSHNEIASNVRTDIGELARIYAASMDIRAANSIAQAQTGSDNAKAAGGGVASGSAAQSTTAVNAVARVDVARGVSLNVVGDRWTDPGFLWIETRNALSSRDRAVLSTGGLIQGADARSEVDADLSGRINIGEGVTMFSTGSVRLGGTNTAAVNTRALVKTYGAVGDAGGRSESRVNADHTITIGEDAYLKAYGNMALTAGQGVGGWTYSDVATDARTDVYNYTAVPVNTRPNAVARSTSDALLTIGAGARVDGVLDVALAAYEGSTSASADGTGHNPFLEDLVGAFGSTTVRRSSSSANSSSAVTLDGDVRAGIYRDQSVVIGSDGSVTFGPDTDAVVVASVFNPRAELEAQIQALSAAHAAALAHGDVEEAVSLQGQIDALELLKSSVASGTVPVLHVSDLFAAGGNVTVNARTLQGAGSVTAYGSPKISVVNESSRYLSLGRMTIPDQHTGGAVVFTGSAGGSQAAQAGWSIHEVDAAGGSVISVKNTYDAGSAIGPAIYLNGDVSNLRGLVEVYNRSGSLGQFASVHARQIQYDVPSGSFVVNLPGEYYSVGGFPIADWASFEILPSTPHQAVAYVANAVFNRDGQFTTGADFGNYLKDPLGMMYPPTSGGISYVFWHLPNCIVGAVNCIGKAFDMLDLWQANFPTDVIVTSEMFGGGYTLLTPPVRSLTHSGSFSQSNPQGGLVIAGGQIGINAKYIDINGTLRSGRQGNWSINVLPEAQEYIDALTAAAGGSLEGERFEVPQQGAHGMLWHVIGAGDAAPKLMYDPATGQFVVESVNASGGGYVSLHGQIMSTNQLGKIEVYNGFGHVTIDNRTHTPILLNDINTGENTVAIVKVTDTGQWDTRGGAWQPLTTWYVNQLGQGLSVFDNRNGAVDFTDAHLVSVANTNQSTYQPLLGQRFEWSRSATLVRDLVDLPSGILSRSQFENLADSTAWQWLYPDTQPNNPWLTTTRVTVGNSTDLADFEQRIDGSIPSIFGMAFAQGIQVNYSGNTDRNRGFPTEEAVDWTYVLPWALNIEMTSSVRADNPIGIHFIGEERGQVRVNSPAGILIGGTIQNSFGDTHLTAVGQGGAIVQSPAGLITSDSLTMEADGNIGSDLRSIRAVLDGGTLSATSRGGNVFIDVPAGSVQLGVVQAGGSGHGGNVLLTIDQDISSAELVRGAAISIESARGAIGSLQSPVNLEAISTLHADGSVSGGLFSAWAVGDIFVAQEHGDLRLVEVVSTGGDVGIAVGDGRIVNSVQERTVDAARQAELATIWDQLHLRGEAAFTDALEHTVRPYEIAVLRNYEEFWQLQARGAESDGQFLLANDRVDDYRARAAAALGLSDPTDAQVQSYVSAYYAELSDGFIDVFGEEWRSSAHFLAYDDAYVYTAPADVVEALTLGSQWQETQLVYQISENALLPGSGAHLTQDPNVSGRNVTLSSGTGGVGSLAEPLVIALPSEPGGVIELSDREKAALAGASLPGDVTVVYEGDRPVEIRIVQTQPIFISAHGTVHVTSAADAYLQTAGSLNVQLVDAGGDIRLIAGESVIQAGEPGVTAIVGGGDLAIDASAGAVGSEENPLTFDVAGILGSARSNTALHLARVGGDLRFDQIFSNGSVGLSARDGAIYAERADLSIVAGGGLNLVAQGGATGASGALHVDVVGLLTGSMGGNVAFVSPGAPLVVGDMSAANLMLEAGSLMIDGQVEVGASADFTATGAVEMSSGAHLTASAVAFDGSTVQMADGAEIDAAGVAALSATVAMQVGSVRAGGIVLTAGGSVTQTQQARLITPGTLAVSSVGGQYLLGANEVAAFEAINAGSGEIRLTNTARTHGGTLTVAGVQQAARNAVTIDNSGNVQIERIQASGGRVGVSASGSIVNGAASGAVIAASEIDLNASGSIGGAGASLQIDSGVGAAGAVTAVATHGVYLQETSGELRLAQIVAGGSVGLRALQGGIYSEHVGVGVTAGAGIDVTAAGDVTGTSGSLHVALGEHGAFTGVAGGAVSLTSDGRNVTVGEVSTGGAFSLDAENLVFVGRVESGASVNLTAADEIRLEAGAGVTAASALLDGGAIWMAEGSHVHADLGTAAMHSSSTLQVSSVRAAEILLAAGGAVTQTANGGLIAGTLDVSSVGGQTLDGGNAVSVFRAVNAGPGDIRLTNGDELLQSTLTIAAVQQAAGGHVVVGHGGNVLVEQIQASGGRVALSAAGSILSGAGSGASADIAAGSLELTAGGGIGDEGRSLRIDSGFGGAGTVRAAAMGDVYLYEVSGDLYLDRITSQGNAVLVADGSIAGTDEADVNIQSHSVTLTSLTGAIGESGRGLAIDSSAAGMESGTVTATAAGGIYVVEVEGDLRLEQIAAGGSVRLSAAQGGILSERTGVSIQAGGGVDLSARDDVSGEGGFLHVELGNDDSLHGVAGGDFLVAAVGAMTVGDVSAGSGIALTGESLSLAGDVAAGGVVELAATERLSLETGAHVFAVSAFLQGGTIAMVDGATIDALGGPVVMNSGGALEVSSVRAEEILLSAGGAVTQTANAGLVAGTLDVTSVGGQILSGANAVALLRATNAGAGEIHFTNDAGQHENTLTVAHILQEFGGAVRLANSGDVLVEQILAHGGSVRISALGSIGNTSGIGAVVEAAVVELTAGDRIGRAGLALRIDSGASGPGLVSASAFGDIVIHETSGDLLLGRIQSEAGEVHLAADRSIARGTDGEVDIQAGHVTLSAGSGSIGEEGNAVTLDSSFAVGDGTEGRVTATAAGDVHLAETVGDFRLHQILAGGFVGLDALHGDIIAERPDVSIVSGSGIDLRAHGDVTGHGGALHVVFGPDGRFTGRAGGDFVAAFSEHDGTIGDIAAGGTLALIGGSLTVAGDLQASEIRVASGGTVTQSASGRLVAEVLDVTSVGGQTLVGANAVALFRAANAGAGDIRLTNIAEISGGLLTVEDVNQVAGADVVVSHAGDVVVEQIRANGGAVSITATGSIMNAAGDDAKIAAAEIDLTAGGAIGATMQSIRIDSGVGAPGSVRAAASDGIYLRELSGDMGIDRIASGGDVSLWAEGSIVSAVGETAAVVGNDVNLASQTGTIGAADHAILIRAAGAVTASAVGDIDLAQTDGELRLDQILAGGSVRLNALQGGIFSERTDVSVYAGGGVDLTALGSVTGQGGALHVALGSHETLTGSAGGDFIVASVDRTMTAGNVYAGGTLLIAASQLTVAGGLISGGVAELTAAEQLALETAAHVTAGGAHLKGGTIAMANGSKIDAGIGTVTMNSDGTLQVSSVNAGQTRLTAGDVVTQTANSSLRTGTLDVSSVGGQMLNGGNAVGQFRAINAEAGAIRLTNRAETHQGTLTLSDVRQTDGGNVYIENAGDVQIGQVAASGGRVTISASGEIENGSGTGAVIAAAEIDLAAQGGIGKAGELLRIDSGVGGAGTVRASATSGVYLYEVSGDLVIDHIVSAADVNLRAFGSIAGTDGAGVSIQSQSVGLTSLTGAIGESGNALLIDSSAVTATAAGGVYLAEMGGDLRINHILAGGSVQLSALQGSIYADRSDVSIQAEMGVDLRTQGDVAGESGSLYIALGSQGALTGIVGGELSVASLDRSLLVGDLETGGRLVLEAGRLVVGGTLGAGATAELYATDQLELGAGAHVSAREIVLSAGAAVLQTASGRLSAERLDVSSVGGQTLEGDNAVAIFRAINAESGDVRFANNAENHAGRLTVAQVQQEAGGAVSIDNAGSVSIGQILAGGGRVDIRTSGSIENGAGEEASVSAAEITLKASGSIGTGEMALRIDSAFGGAGTVTADAGDGIHLHEVRGDLGLGRITAQGDVALVADGAILGAEDGPGIHAPDVLGNHVTLVSLTGTIGETNRSLVIDSGTVTAAASGSIYLTEAAGDLNIHDIRAHSGDVVLNALFGAITSERDDVAVEAAGGLHLVAQAHVNGGHGALQVALGPQGVLTGAAGGNVALSSVGPLTVGDLTVDGALLLTAGDVTMAGLVTSTGTVDIVAADLMLMDGEARLVAANAALSGGSVHMAEGAQVDVGPGVAAIASDRGIHVSRVQADGGITLTANGAVSQTAGGRLATGGTLDVTSNGSQRLTADNRVTSFRAINIGSGDIRLTNGAESLNLTHVEQRASGNVFVENAGNVRVEQIAAVGGNVDVQAHGTIRSGEGSGASIVAGAVSLFAGSSIGNDDHFLRIDTSVGDTGAVSGTVTASVYGDIFIAEIGGDLRVNQILSQTGNVTLTAAGSIVNATGATVNVLGNRLTMTSLNGQVGRTGQALLIDSSYSRNDVVAINAQGDIVIREVSGDLHLWQMLAGPGNIELTVDGALLNWAPANVVNLQGNNVSVTTINGALGRPQNKIVVLYHGRVDATAGVGGPHILRMQTIRSGYTLTPDGESDGGSGPGNGNGNGSGNNGNGNGNGNGKGVGNGKG